MGENQRTDTKTAEQISEALHMKQAFGEAAALEFLRRRAVPDELAQAALAGRYERRQVASPGR